MKRIVRRAAGIALWATAILCLTITVVPRFLDRIYYRGATGDHFDGARFFNPDGEDTARAPGGGNRAAFLWRQATGGDDRPRWPERVAIDPARPAELRDVPVGSTDMRVTWIGHATALVQVAGLNILTDPIYADNAGPFGFGPRRVAAPGVAIRDLPRIDLILVSHNHYDHLDRDTLRTLWQRDHPRIVTSLGNDAILRSAGIDATALDWGQGARIDGAVVHVVRNHHWGSRWFVDRNRALWSAFVVRLPGGNLFFAGDTGMGDGRWIEEARALGPIRLALIPIGAFRFAPGQMESGAHVGPVDALAMFRRLGAWRGIPIHWGTFRLSYEGWDTPPRLLDAAKACGGESAWPVANRRFATLRIGRPFAVPSIAEVRVPSPSATPSAWNRAAVLDCLDTPEVHALR